MYNEQSAAFSAPDFFNCGAGFARRRAPSVAARLPPPVFYVMEVSCNVPYLSAQKRQRSEVHGFRKRMATANSLGFWLVAVPRVALVLTL